MRLKLLLLLFVLLIPSLASAAGITSFLTPSPVDLSIRYLSDIFGVVDGVLHGTGSQILGTMFGVFNAAILSVGGTIIMYILIVSTVNTAHHGEVMGPDWSELWLPIRAIVGIGAMLPKASGYSLIQVFVMWIVVQGIGAADHVWGAALTYFARGGILVQATQSLASLGAINPDLVYPAGNILKDETCMYTLRNSLYATKSTVPDFTSTLLVHGLPSHLYPPIPTDKGGYIEFPGNVSYAGRDWHGACGSVTWTFTLDSSQVTNYANLAAGDSRSIAVQQMVLDQEPLAYTLAQIILPSSPNQPASNLKATDFAPNAVVNSALDYMGIILPALKASQDRLGDTQKAALAQALLDGWILAGSYYFTLSQLNNAFTAQETSAPNVTVPTSFSAFNDRARAALGPNITPTVVSDCKTKSTDCTTGAVNCFDAYICNEWKVATNTLTPKPIKPPIPTPDINPHPGGGGSETWAETGAEKSTSWISDVTGGFGDFVGAWRKSGKAPDWAGWAPSIPNFGAGKVESWVVNELPSKFSDLMVTLNKLLTAETQKNTDPIIAISAMGSDIIAMVEYVWITGAIAAFVMAAVGSWCMAQLPFGNAISGFIMWFIPMLTGVMFTMFVSGAVMAYYVPMIPFIVYLFAAIGWFTAVIEAMVAAPFVAIGIIVPEGHAHFGQAQHAIMLLLNVFIRPSMIVFGFIAGSILAHVSLWLLNQGLGTAMTIGGLTSAVKQDTTKILQTVAIILIYMTIVLDIVDRCFALIHEVPTNVLSWIGGQARSFGEDRAGGIKQAFEGKIGGVGKAAETMGEVGAKGGEMAGGAAGGTLRAAGKGLKGAGKVAGRGLGAAYNWLTGKSSGES